MPDNDLRTSTTARSRSFATGISKPRTARSSFLSVAPDAASLRSANDRRARGDQHSPHPLNSRTLSLQIVLLCDKRPGVSLRRMPGICELCARQHDCEACALKLVLPKRACTQDRALHSRSRSRQGPRNRKDRGLRCLTSRTKEVEMPFAYLKGILRLDRLRLRGPSGAKDEFLLAPQPKTSGNWRSSSPFPEPSFAT
jgi:hypothetical protein